MSSSGGGGSISSSDSGSSSSGRFGSGSGRGCDSSSGRRETTRRFRDEAVRVAVVADKATVLDFDSSGARGGSSSSSGVSRGVVGVQWLWEEGNMALHGMELTAAVVVKTAVLSFGRCGRLWRRRWAVVESLEAATAAGAKRHRLRWEEGREPTAVAAAGAVTIRVAAM